jgi:ABC-type Fe3+ transport system substrate-binding protein
MASGLAGLRRRWTGVGARVVFFAMAIALLGACAGPRPAAPAAGSDRQAPAATRSAALQQIVDAARGEGGVLNILNVTYSDADFMDELSKAMERQWGFPIRVNIVPGPAPSEYALTFAKEYQAGKPASSDVFLGDDVNVLPQQAAGSVLLVDWKALVPDLPDGVASKDGAFVRFYSRFITNITYNSDAIKGADVPKTQQDLLNPRWQKQIVSTPFVCGFREAAALFGREQEMADLLRQLKAGGNLAGVMRGGEDTRVASGEFNLFVFSCSESQARRLRAKGAPVDYTVLQDLAIRSYWTIAVPKHSPHPNLAQLFAIYMVSREGQELFWKHFYTDLHLLPGSRSMEEYRTKFGDLKALEVTDQVLEEKGAELDRVRPALERAITGS